MNSLLSPRQLSTNPAALMHDFEASPAPYTLPLRGGDDIRAKTRALCKRLRVRVDGGACEGLCAAVNATVKPEVRLFVRLFVHSFVSGRAGVGGCWWLGMWPSSHRSSGYLQYIRCGC